MIVKGEKLAYHMQHGLWRLLNFVRIPTVRNSNKKPFIIMATEKSFLVFFCLIGILWLEEKKKL